VRKREKSGSLSARSPRSLSPRCNAQQQSRRRSLSLTRHHPHRLHHTHTHTHTTDHIILYLGIFLYVLPVSLYTLLLLFFFLSFPCLFNEALALCYSTWNDRLQRGSCSFFTLLCYGKIMNSFFKPFFFFFFFFINSINLHILLYYSFRSLEVLFYGALRSIRSALLQLKECKI
jgi:hypothetical protein